MALSWLWPLLVRGATEEALKSASISLSAMFWHLWGLLSLTHCLQRIQDGMPLLLQSSWSAFISLLLQAGLDEQ
jgi:hypothetical protein